MSSVSIACPICHGALEIDPALAGQQVQCPLCHSLLQLPPLHELQPSYPGMPMHPGMGPPPMGMPSMDPGGMPMPPVPNFGGGYGPPGGIGPPPDQGFGP